MATSVVAQHMGRYLYACLPASLHHLIKEMCRLCVCLPSENNPSAFSAHQILSSADADAKKPRRNRTTFSSGQLAALEKIFERYGFNF